MALLVRAPEELLEEEEEEGVGEVQQMEAALCHHGEGRRRRHRHRAVCAVAHTMRVAVRFGPYRTLAFCH
jgi:hypothetical protein